MIDRELCGRIWNRFVEDMECERCGNPDSRVLEFHHRDPSKRKFSPRYKPGRTPSSPQKSLVSVIREMDKCTVLCANCHLIAHWEMVEDEKEAWARRQWEIAEA